jgi:hypothetical protein
MRQQFFPDRKVWEKLLWSASMYINIFHWSIKFDQNDIPPNIGQIDKQNHMIKVFITYEPVLF